MKCIKCSSGFGYMRITKQWVCRNCGWIHQVTSLKQKAKNFAGLSLNE